jgi:pimeloyl-ACP methyl ester carboxylesterase
VIVVHFHRVGAGEPLVLIHGIGSRWQLWRPLLPALAARYDVIAVDLPGFGASPPLPAGDLRCIGSAAAGDGVPGSGSAAADDALGCGAAAAGGGVSDVGSAAGGAASCGSASAGGVCGPGSATADGAPRFGAASPAVTVAEFADAVADLLARLDVRRPRVAGSSLGGGIALELGRRGVACAVAAYSPIGFFGPAGAAWCRAVVGGARAIAGLLDPALPALMATRPGRAALCGVFYGRPGGLLPADCVADARALASADGFDAARRGLGRWRLRSAESSASARRDSTRAAESFAAGRREFGRSQPNTGEGELAQIPVTIAWGSRDLVLPRWQAERARKLLPTARHVRLNGCGHLPFADDPGACSRLLLDL